MSVVTTSPMPLLLPTCLHARVAIFAIRRMGAHGLTDARAAHALLTLFGRDFSRPLVLMRAFMADLAGTVTGTIAIAPCCCPRMTYAESALVTVLARAETDPERARFLLGDLTGARRIDGVLATAAAAAAAFADAGRPIRI